MIVRAVVMVAAVALVGVSCSSADDRPVRVAEVKRVLSDAGLRPTRVRIIMTIAKTWIPPTAVNYCAAEAAKPSAGTSLDAGRRAIVMVFDDEDAADDWTPMPECPAKPFRVRNVIAVPTHGRLSPRLRAGLRELEAR